MTPQRLALLVLAALLASGAAFWLGVQRQPETAIRAGDPLLPPLRARLNEITEIRISRGDGSLATLRRGTDGWMVAERAFRADAGKVRKLLLDLSALAIVEEKTTDPARYAVLGVEAVDSPAATGTRIDLKSGTGAAQTLIVGKASGTREGYVRLAAVAASVLARPLIAAEANPARWLDTALVDLDPSRIRTVVLEPLAAPARKLEGAALTAEISAALQGLAFDDLRSTDSASSAPGRAAPYRARYTTGDGLTLDLRGREDGNRRWLTLAVVVESAAAVAMPAAATSAAAQGAPARPDPELEAATLAARFQGREFEIPAYRFTTLFAAAPSPSGSP